MDDHPVFPRGLEPPADVPGRLSGDVEAGADRPRYKWTALAIVTFGALIVSVNQSLVLISLPDIFRGIRVDPSSPGNSGYLLWMLIGFTVVITVLVVTLGRVGDIYGRVPVFSLGFAVVTFFSVMLSITWMSGSSGALWIIAMRVGQGFGGALIFANASAIITDTFSKNQRGFALGIYIVTLNAGGFIGLIVGGVLAPLWWHLIFMLTIPFGLLGTVVAYTKLEDRGTRTPSKIDWLGNLAFAVGLIAILIGITYGLLPYAGHSMGWTSPVVHAEIGGGVVVLGVFAYIETKVAAPMFRLTLFRVRAFSAGNVASFLGALSRGGLLVMLIVWLQGIWLPLHGFSFSQTPLWAGIYMVPLTVGFLVAGPVSGVLADRFGARPFATGGLLVVAATFAMLLMLPVDFSYWSFAPIIFLNSVGIGIFIAPNQAGIMNSLPAEQRGAGAGMAGTFNWSGQVLSTGIFFTLTTIGLSSRLASTLYRGLLTQGVGRATALRVSHLSPVASLFAAFLGDNPMKTLLGPSALAHLPVTTSTRLTSREFFPQLVSGPFSQGLTVAFSFAIGVALLGATVSLLRGGKFVYETDEPVVSQGRSALEVSSEEAIAETEPLLGE